MAIKWTDEVIEEVQTWVNRGMPYIMMLKRLEKFGIKISQTKYLKRKLYDLEKKKLLQGIKNKKVYKRHESSVMDKVWCDVFIKFLEDNGYNYSYKEISAMSIDKIRDTFGLTIKNSKKLKKIATENKDRKPVKVGTRINELRKALMRKDLIAVVHQKDLEIPNDQVVPFCKKSLIDKIFFVDRYDEAEGNPDYIQVIPYVAVRYKDKILVGERSSSEERLNDYLTIGFGGHMGKEDSTLESCAIREMQEELGLIIKRKNLEYCGALYTDITPVSAEHLCLFYVLEINREQKNSIKLNNEHKAIRFKTLEFCLDNIDKFEIWSQIIVRSLANDNIS